MPALFQNGAIVYYAAFKNHISLFSAASRLAKFEKELAKYERSKGTIRFPLGARIPYGLISRIVKFRVAENGEKVKAKKERRES